MGGCLLLFFSFFCFVLFFGFFWSGGGGRGRGYLPGTGWTFMWRLCRLLLKVTWNWRVSTLNEVMFGSVERNGVSYKKVKVTHC